LSGLVQWKTKKARPNGLVDRNGSSRHKDARPRKCYTRTKREAHHGDGGAEKKTEIIGSLLRNEIPPMQNHEKEVTAGGYESERLKFLPQISLDT